MMGKEREDTQSLVHIAAVEHHRRQDVAQCCSRAASVVCISQVLFLTIGYTHQLAFEGELRLEKIHVSGMLDNETRSLLCGTIAIISGIALLAGELTRPVSAYLPLRLVLAGACGVGKISINDPFTRLCCNGCRTRAEHSQAVEATNDLARNCRGDHDIVIWLLHLNSEWREKDSHVVS